MHAFTNAPEALIERAITLRIHKNEEENKNERSSTSRVSFSFFCTRAHAHETKRVLARKGERARFLVFPKVASSKFKFRGRPRRKARDKNGARSGHATRREGKIVVCSLFFFARSIEKERRSHSTRGYKIFASNLPFRMSFQLPFVVVVVFPLDFSLAARLKKKKR